MNRVRVEVAEYFCEDPNAFKLEECFNIMHKFCCRLVSFDYHVAEVFLLLVRAQV